MPLVGIVALIIVLLIIVALYFLGLPRRRSVSRAVAGMVGASRGYGVH